ncbi:hypothetical protein VP01_247g1 [Puccinia sorghi]|uniref:Uncharacterized protein n=1 Tax=Puccinia sorghi TaxID=27349 RepID=A0A0L6V5Y5_9BASI|nr:hypothetical protein VP01_247g1 [Puccinia sorghi]
MNEKKQQFFFQKQEKESACLLIALNATLGGPMRQLKTCLTHVHLPGNPHTQIPWAYLFSMHNNRAFVTTMGADCHQFFLFFSRDFNFKS